MLFESKKNGREKNESFFRRCKNATTASHLFYKRCLFRKEYFIPDFEIENENFLNFQNRKLKIKDFIVHGNTRVIKLISS